MTQRKPYGRSTRWAAWIDWATAGSVKSFIGHSTIGGLQDGLDPVSEIVDELLGCEAAVYFAVDATQLVKTLQVRGPALMLIVPRN